MSNIEKPVTIFLLVLFFGMTLFGGVAAYSMFSGQSLSLISSTDTVYIPMIETVGCEQTRLECYPNTCNNNEDDYYLVDDSGESFYCGTNNPPTVANYPLGCKYYIKGEGLFDFSSYEICNADGTNCETATRIPDSSSWTTTTERIEITSGQKLFVNPTGTVDLKLRMTAPVYGLRIRSATNAVDTNDCSLASALNKNQIKLFLDDSDYSKILVASELQPNEFSKKYITGYINTISNLRVIDIGEDSWYIKEIGYRCAIKKDTANNNVVDMNNCVADDSIECFPGVGNCDSDGKLTTADKTACIPNTVISYTRQSIGDEACSWICNDDGQIEYDDCIDISKPCEGDLIRNLNYECVEKLDLTERVVCEADGGNWVRKDSRECGFLCDIGIKAPIITSEEYCKSTTYMPLIIGIIGLLLAYGITKFGQGRGTLPKRRK